MSTDKMRLDKLLASRGYFSSRSKAKRAIMAGEVRVDQELIDKAGTEVSVDADIDVEEKQRFVSRGGKKLKEALEKFEVDTEGRVVLDVGSSTGGFTDCLLQGGASEVYAVDSGTNQLAWKLRQDGRVTVMEQTNFRYLQPEDIEVEFDLVTIDVSFISLSLIIPVAVQFMKEGAGMISLIKPQFEAGPENVQEGGIVRDPAVHIRVITDIVEMARENNLSPEGLIPSPITGGKSQNIEYLLYSVFGTAADSNKRCGITDEMIERTVEKAQSKL